MCGEGEKKGGKCTNKYFEIILGSLPIIFLPRNTGVLIPTSKQVIIARIVLIDFMYRVDVYLLKSFLI